MSPTLPDLLSSFKTSAFRIEARDEYLIEEEQAQLDEFRQTGRSTPSSDDIEWQNWIRKVRKSGREIGRVRLVGIPLNLYTRFELDYYGDLVSAGERIRILERSRVRGRSGPWGEDFYLFDEAIVAVMQYTPAGEWTGARIIDDSDAVIPYRQVARTALEISVDLADFHPPKETWRVA